MGSKRPMVVGEVAIKVLAHFLSPEGFFPEGSVTYFLRPEGFLPEVTTLFDGEPP